MSNQVRIQTYIDSHLSQLLFDYAETNGLTISKAVSRLLADSLATPSILTHSQYVTKAEFEKFVSDSTLQLQQIDDAARISYSNFDSRLRELSLSISPQKPSKSQGFRPRS